LCLNCGAEYSLTLADPQCPACGLSRHQCPAALGLVDTVGDDPIGAARADFAQGLFRRGIAILNQALLEGRELLEAWFLKARFLHKVGFNRTGAQMLDGALAKFSRPEDRIRLLEEQSYLWAECDRGEEALGSADAAAKLGSASIRTHYLRGRALALVGRLEEAREEMLQVLALDPNNADGQRGLKMIDDVRRSKARKRWWQLWKQ
jgi:tetratricopeptide (TPR) repeat protein